jgi:hypothetical protein
MRKLCSAGIVIVLVAGLTSCTIEKRRYRDGFYVDWNHSAAKSSESTALTGPVVSPEVREQIVVPDVANSIGPEVRQTEVIPLTTDLRTPLIDGHGSEPETPEEINLNPEKSQTHAPIEKDKKQAIGAGVAAAIFFILAMVGLIIKGTAPPVGIFIGAAFLCCILCIVLASFLYPRDPVVKQPKEPAAASPASTVTLIAGIVIAAIILSVLGVLAFFFFSLIGIF